jgi:hypothetical protein
MVDALLADPGRTSNRESIARSLHAWQDDARAVQPLLDTFLLQEAVPLVARLSDVAGFGLRALQAIEQATPLTLTAAETAQLADATKPMAEVLLMVAAPIQRLVEAAGR